MAEGFTYTVDPQFYIVEDRPRVSGSASDSAGAALTPLNVAFLTLRATDNLSNTFLEESAVSLATGGAFTLNFPTEIGYHSFGWLYCRAFWLDGVTATLNGALSDSDTTANFTVTTGAIAPDGYIKIDDEILKYTRTSTTSADIERAQYGTEAAAHADTTACSFTSVWQTAINSYEMKAETDDRQLSRFVMTRMAKLG